MFSINHYDRKNIKTSILKDSFTGLTGSNTENFLKCLHRQAYKYDSQFFKVARTHQQGSKSNYHLQEYQNLLHKQLKIFPVPILGQLIIDGLGWLLSK